MFNWFWRFLYNLVKSILYCIDFILDFAKMLAGISPVTVDGVKTDLTFYFLGSEPIMDGFMLIALIGIVLLFLFSAFSVTRSIGRLGEGKSALMVCADAGKALLYLLLMPAIMLGSTLFVSAVMTSIFNATSIGGSSLGGRLFTLIADDAYTFEDLPKEEVFANFANRISGFDYYSSSNVGVYFDRSEMNYFLGFVGGISVLVLLIRPLLTFVERTVGLVLLFLAAPISISTVVLDDGARFKLWREQVINKFLVAYGALISLNVFVMLVEVVYSVTFFDSSFQNGLARMIFVIGGAAACKMGPVIIGNLVNSGAGSQYAQDVANTSMPFARMGHAMAHIGGGWLRASGGFFKGKISSAMHSRGDARRAAKADIAKEQQRQKMDERLERRSASNRNIERIQRGRADVGDRNKTGGSSNFDPLRSELRGRSAGYGGVQSSLQGNKQSAQVDNSSNKRGADTIVTALENAKKNTSDKGGAK